MCNLYEQHHGHIPRELSRCVWLFIQHGGMVDGPELILTNYIRDHRYHLKVGNEMELNLYFREN
jgi:hypothetical protein